jgi:hypothetical protein
MTGMNQIKTSSRQDSFSFHKAILPKNRLSVADASWLSLSFRSQKGEGEDDWT